MDAIKNTKSLLKLAKGTTTQTTTAAPIKEKVVKPKEPIVVTKEDKRLERDRKAKETVQNLLSDIDLNPLVKQAEIIVKEEPKLINKADDNRLWLEDQVSLLTEQCELLKAELNNSGASSTHNGSEAYVVQKTVELFLELQDRHFQWGRNFIINPKQFMNRLIELFPYLTQYKTFVDD